MPRLIRIVLVAAVLLAGSPAGRASAQEAGPVYIVQEGDTLFTIAVKFGTTVEALVEANAIADASLISPGLRLVLPGFEDVTGVLTTHEAVFGESLASLAAAYRVSSPSLARLNRLVNPARLYVGQPIIVPELPETVPSATVAFLPSDEGLLEAGVTWGVNPWTATAGRAALWRVPEERVYLPGGDGLPTDLPPGLVSVSIDPAFVVQGLTAVLRVETSGEGIVPEGRLGNSSLHLMADAGGSETWIALQGIHALQPLGLIELEMRVTRDGIEAAHVQPVRVVDGGYGREALQGVPAETLDPANTGPEDVRVAEVVAAASPERLWTGVFQFPTSYFETFPSRFGTRRSYNGSEYRYYHTGLDLYGNSQTPVLAPAPGVVVFAGQLTVRGNVTYIDHGWGVYSGYLHQSELLVQPGDRVETGDTIGMVGATGRVTGAHLHWEIWVGGVPVNPLEWTERELP